MGCDDQLKVANKVILGSSALQLASYFNDHMVLQMAPMQATIWGYAEELALIRVTLDEKNYSVSSSFYRTWSVVFDPVPAGGPYTISIESIGESGNVGPPKAQLSDVLFGDVWICSGQSNMELTVPLVINATEELARSYEYPEIRIFSVKKDVSNVPLDDIKSAYVNWSLPNPDTLGQGKPGRGYWYFSAVCWFYGRDLYNHFGYPIGLISSNWGGTPVEAWSSQDAIDACQYLSREKRAFRDDTILWNSMIHPFSRMVIKGAIWYQGERNTNAPDTYNCTFPAMIDDWRNKWYEGTGGLTNKKFPFGFVQLCTSDAVQPGLIGNYPILRWHQTADFGYAPNPRMENVFMAVSVDLPDPTSPLRPIHPRYKQDVSRRLALASRAVAYAEKDLVFAGPFPTNITITSTSFTIEFDHGNANIKVVNDKGFEICCVNSLSSCAENDQQWISVTVNELVAPSIVRFSHPCESMITQVRYLWREYPCTFKRCALYSVENNLPTPPFIYDIIYDLPSRLSTSSARMIASVSDLIVISTILCIFSNNT
ncbi:sialate O-acetylesterase-like isoform X1 [Anneissia japonica]|uniref:sialate O-acetylesterase-like isoform X1 n=2 Tax=Anneissia japonica TaxID=1529436 RepID=UPI0014255435|nr:sialate O-acetylesterase-like isoform X1 [Anneissia japonica]